jgi:hypothetical protein
VASAAPAAAIRVAALPRGAHEAGIALVTAVLLVHLRMMLSQLRMPAKMTGP